ncbi:MAG: YybH family protein [Candidatus Sulfotelmatobacter sp.]
MKFGLWLAIVSTACLAGAQTTQDVKNKDVPAFLRQLADTRKTIADGYVRWTEAAKAKNVDAIVSIYTDDATVLPEEKEAASGKNAVRAFYVDWFAKQDKLIEQKFENINSFQEGDLLIDSTKYSGLMMQDGKEVPFKGKRLVVWKREFQGPWKILRDTWNKPPMQ